MLLINVAEYTIHIEINASVKIAKVIHISKSQFNEYRQIVPFPKFPKNKKKYFKTD